MFAQLRSALMIFIGLSIVTGVIYPLAVTGIGKMAFPAQVAGSLVARGNGNVGSSLIGQSFQDDKYFWGRLSATSPMANNAAASAGSNFGPTNPARFEAVKARVAALKTADPDNHFPVPVDLVTASASGLDPHISPAAAAYQIARVARARHLDAEQVRGLVLANTEGPQWGIFGEPRVNVLMLNLTLDRTR